MTASVAQVTFVAFVERDDEGHRPTLGGEAKETDGVVSLIQGSGLDGQAAGFAAAIERH